MARSLLHVRRLTRHEYKVRGVSGRISWAPATEETRAETLLDRVKALYARSLAILDRAERDGDFRVALRRSARPVG